MKHERRRIGKALLFAVLIAMLTFLSIGSVSAAQQHYVNPDESIQGAIDNANAGDTIIVRDGTYTENVDVNVNHLTIKSENGYDSTIVQAANTSDHVFAVTADYVNITGFTVTCATGDYKGGIYLYGAENCFISDNNVSNNYRGIYLYHSSNNSLINNTAKENSNVGIFLSSSCNNSLTGNTASNNNDSGIFLYSSSNNSLTGNTASNNTYSGIYMSSSSNYNTLTDNTATDNTDDGIRLYSSSNNSLMDNTVKENKYGIGLFSSSNYNTLTDNTASNNTYDGISLYSSCNNSLMANTVKDNINGISLYSSCNNTVTDNTAANNTYGIFLSTSSNNSLMDNTVKDNTYGIYLYSSCNNNLIYNNYFNNTNNAHDSGNNTWNITKTAGTNIIGGPYIGGNYWSDYAGEDLTEDGLGDTLVPYNSSGDIANGGDSLPLVKPSASSVFATDAGTADAIGGTSTCDKFTDVNGKVYTDWILAIRLE